MKGGEAQKQKMLRDEEGKGYNQLARSRTFLSGCQGGKCGRAGENQIRKPVNGVSHGLDCARPGEIQRREQRAISENQPGMAVQSPGK